MLIDFTKFCYRATVRFLIIGFVYTGVLFAVYGHANQAPELLYGAVHGFEILSGLFGLATIIAASIIAGRFVARKITDAIERKLFA